MAAGSLLPLFHEQTVGRMADPPNDGDDFLAELLGGAGVSLLSVCVTSNSFLYPTASPFQSRTYPFRMI